MRWGAAGTHLTLPAAWATGPLPLPPDGRRGHRRSTTWVCSHVRQVKARRTARQIRGRQRNRGRARKVPKTAAPVFGSAYRRPMPYAGALDLSRRAVSAGCARSARFRRARRRADRRADGSRRHQPRRRAARPARGARRRAHRPLRARAEVAPRGECNVADIGDVPMRARFSLEDSIADIEAFFARGPRGRRASRSRSAATIRSPIRS